MQTQVEHRLGSKPKAIGASAIKKHKWFAGFDWAALEEGKMAAPFVPELKTPFDTSNFDFFADDEDESNPFNDGDGQETDQYAHQQFSWEQWGWIDDVKA